jgi:hypothetical protein
MFDQKSRWYLKKISVQPHRAQYKVLLELTDKSKSEQRTVICGNPINGIVKAIQNFTGIPFSLGSYQISNESGQSQTSVEIRTATSYVKEGLGSDKELYGSLVRAILNALYSRRVLE